MIQLYLTKRRRLRAIRGLYERACLASDPLWHPVLRAMSAAELADIPFPRPGRAC